MKWIKCWNSKRWIDCYVWREEGDDGGGDESGYGADGAGNALENAGILRRQVDVTQEESSHDGDLAASLTQRQQEDGHVAIIERQLTHHKHAERRQEEPLTGQAK